MRKKKITAKKVEAPKYQHGEILMLDHTKFEHITLGKLVEVDGIKGRVVKLGEKVKFEVE